MPLEFDWIKILPDLKEIMELADIGHRHKRAVDLLLDGKEIDIPKAQFSDKYRKRTTRMDFRHVTPVEHQSVAATATAAAIAVPPHPSTNHEREVDRAGSADPNAAAVCSVP